MTAKRSARGRAKPANPALVALGPRPEDEEREHLDLYVEDIEGLRQMLKTAIAEASEYLDSLAAHEGMDAAFLKAAPREFVQINALSALSPEVFGSISEEGLKARKVMAALSVRAARSRLGERATQFEAAGDLVSAATAALDGMRHALVAAGDLLGVRIDTLPLLMEKAGTEAKATRARNAGILNGQREHGPFRAIVFKFIDSGLYPSESAAIRAALKASGDSMDEKNAARWVRREKARLRKKKRSS